MCRDYTLRKSENTVVEVSTVMEHKWGYTGRKKDSRLVLVSCQNWFYIHMSKKIPMTRDKCFLAKNRIHMSDITVKVKGAFTEEKQKKATKLWFCYNQSVISETKSLSSVETVLPPGPQQ